MSQIVKTLQITIPIMINSKQVEENMEEDDENDELQEDFISS